MALLDFPLQLFALSVDLSEIVVGELALLFSDLSRSLLPISFDTIPVYGLFLHDKNGCFRQRRIDSEVPRSVFE